MQYNKQYTNRIINKWSRAILESLSIGKTTLIRRLIKIKKILICTYLVIRLIRIKTVNMPFSGHKYLVLNGLDQLLFISLLSISSSWFSDSLCHEVHLDARALLFFKNWTKWERTELLWGTWPSNKSSFYWVFWKNINLR